MWWGWGGERAEVFVPWASLPQFPVSPRGRATDFCVGWQWDDRRCVIRNWITPAALLTVNNIHSENYPQLSVTTGPSAFTLRVSESASQLCLTPNTSPPLEEQGRRLLETPHFLTYLCVGSMVQNTCMSTVLFFPVKGSVIAPLKSLYCW